MKALRNRILTVVIFATVALCCTGCTTAQKAQVRHDFKSIVGLGEAAALEFSEAEIRDALKAIR